jgi:hypothetical protein
MSQKKSQKQLKEKPQEKEEAEETPTVESLQEEVNALKDEQKKILEDAQTALIREREQNAFLMDTIRTFNSLARKVDDLIAQMQRFAQQQQGANRS